LKHKFIYIYIFSGSSSQGKLYEQVMWQVWGANRCIQGIGEETQDEETTWKTQDYREK